MDKMLDKLPQIVAGVSFLVLVLAIVHEYAYFMVVGPQYQSLMSATDYLVSALSWMPFIGISLFIVGVAMLSFARLAQGRSHPELLESSKHYRRVFAPMLDTLFGSATAFGLALAVLLFGNPYRLGWAQNIVSVGLVSFLFWLQKLDLFARFLTGPVILMVSGLPVLMTMSYVSGRDDGYLALAFDRNVHLMKLKSSVEPENISVLRLMNAGLLGRRIEVPKLHFFRWDQIEELTLEYTPPDPRSLVCRLFGWDCNEIPEALRLPQKTAPKPPEKLPPEG